MLGLPLLTYDILEGIRATKPHAGTIFLLGTGASAAGLSDEKLEYIQSQFAIGINQWALHFFAPDMYAYEYDPDKRLIESLSRFDDAEFPPPVLVLNSAKLNVQFSEADLTDALRRRMFGYSRVNLWSRRKENISSDFMNFARLKNLANHGITLDNGASIARLIFLAVMMKFRQIVLVGVDLNNVDYFWQVDPTLIEGAGVADFSSGQKGSTHETLSSEKRPFPIDTYVRELASGLGEQGIELFVESPASLLAKDLRVFEWASLV